MSCPWADIQKPYPVNLQDIISEAKREKKYLKEVKKGPECPPGDEHVARMLQEEYNPELETSQNDDYDSEEDMDALERKAWEEFDALDREEALIPSYNSLPHDEKVSKFKKIMDEIRNAGETVLFTPKYENTMGCYSFLQFHKAFTDCGTYFSDERQKKPEFENKHHDFKLDDYTCSLLYKLICNKTLRRVNGIIGVGKKSIILHADAEQNYPEKYAIKVFRKDAKGFSNRIEKSAACRMALQEMRNLVKLTEAGIPCPRVVTVKKHILVMSFIGDNLLPAPSLNQMSGDFNEAYDQVINILKTMYREADLIFSELTDKNIVWYKNQCYIIDVSRVVDGTHDDTILFLCWGCSNISKFFKKKNVETMPPQELFEFITGMLIHRFD